MPLGRRQVIAEVLRDSYGEAKQQHTFTLVVMHSEGYDALTRGHRIQRKGHNLYRNGTERQRWLDKRERRVRLGEKHRRGAEA